jgi:hypothetical protein
MKKSSIIDAVFVIMAVLLAFVVKAYILSYDHSYQDDMRAYEGYYNVLSDTLYSGFIDLDARQFIGSNDWLSNHTFFFFSKLVSFDFFSTMVYMFYTYLVALIFVKLKLRLAALIFPFTFYSIGIASSGLRLTMAIACFLFLYTNRRYYFSSIAVLYHAQIIPIYTLAFDKSKAKKTFLISIALVAIFLSPSLVPKFIYYYHSNTIAIFTSFVSLYGVFSILIAGFLSCRKKSLKLILYILPTAFAILILGAGRLNIILYFIFLLWLLECDRVNYKGVILLYMFLVYDTFKGVMFIESLIDGNNGYSGIVF